MVSRPCGTDVELSASQTQTSQALDSSTSVWINEFHYDNAGGDVAEGVEIAGEAGTDLSGYSIVLYNGSSSSGASYKTEDLSGVIPDEGAGSGALWFAISGIQNGGPDGVAFVGPSGLLQFLSYEGTFTGVGGVADGITSTEIPVAETSSTAEGLSMQLTGTASAYADFTWVTDTTASPGIINVDQVIQASDAPDTVAPRATSMSMLSLSQLSVSFSEPVSLATVLDVSAYTIAQEVAGVEYDGDSSTATLTLVTPATAGTAVSLTLTSIEDEAGNAIEETTLTAIYNDLATGLFITEIYYNDPGSFDNLEFIEIFNSGSDEIAMGGLRIDDGIELSSQVLRHLVEVTMSSSRRQLSFGPMN